MKTSEKQILDLIIGNILSEVQVSNIDNPETQFLIEKVLVNCGLSTDYVSDITEHVKNSLKSKTTLTNTDIVISHEINNFISNLFEDKKKSKSDRLDKIAVRNKQSGAIQLVSKKTYTSNSQLYTPLSAGWAKANVIMIRNKTSGEEYPVLLKNFDPNKHEKITTATPLDKDKEKSDLETKPFSVQKNKKDKKAQIEPAPDSGKDTVKPMMLEPTLQSKTQTAFITPRTAEKEPFRAPKFPGEEEDGGVSASTKLKDKQLSDVNPSDSKSFKQGSYEPDDREYYEDLAKKNLLPSGFTLANKFTIPPYLNRDRSIPSAYIPAIEHLINSTGAEQNPVDVYLPNMPLSTNPNAKISLFEMLLLFSLTLNDEDFAKFKIQIEFFMKKTPDSNLSDDIWEAVQLERELILKYLNKKYEKRFKLIAGSWKVEENLIDLGMDNSDINAEHVSDIFLRVRKDDNTDVLEEFVVTPNKDNLLAILDKSKFMSMFGDSKENIKDKVLLFLLKIFPLRLILKNYVSVVFPDVIYDYFSIGELFKSSDTSELNLKLKSKQKTISLSSMIDKKRIDVLNFINDDNIKIKIDPNFYSKIREINKKIYKIN